MTIADIAMMTLPVIIAMSHASDRFPVLFVPNSTVISTGLVAADQRAAAGVEVTTDLCRNWYQFKYQFRNMA